MTDSVLAAQLYTVREFTKTPQAIAETFRKVRDIGYEAVQISAFGPVDPQDVKRMLDDNGLVCCITHIGYDRLKDDLPAVIEEHKLWNCKHVAVGSMPKQFRDGVEGIRRFVAEANEIGRQLADAGLTFSYHNHSFEFARAGDTTMMDVLFSESDPRYVKAELDTYWVQHGGADPAAWVRRMKDRMPVVHLKDMTIQDNTQVMAEVGEGNMNWPAILDACKEANVEWYAVEQDICQRDPFESLAISYRNLKAMGLQ
ncbi:MAG: xylose isomerase [Anaerolineaceae bacterium]|nr:xylose isomerase [Anaerolineaceae bacterium]